MLYIAMSAMAQKLLFTGIVKDVQGDPIIGASVVEKNASNGSVTDLDGKFSVSTRRDDFETRVKNIGMKVEINCTAMAAGRGATALRQRFRCFLPVSEKKQTVILVKKQKLITNKNNAYANTSHYAQNAIDSGYSVVDLGIGLCTDRNQRRSRTQSHC